MKFSRSNPALMAAVLMAAASASAVAGADGGGGGAVAAAPVGKPGDEKLHPAMQELLLVVDAVDEAVLYSPDPRVQVKQLTEALAKYFRTPD